MFCANPFFPAPCSASPEVQAVPLVPVSGKHLKTLRLTGATRIGQNVEQLCSMRQILILLSANFTAFPQALNTISRDDN